MSLQKLFASSMGLFGLVIADACQAWGPDGHQAVATLAGKLVAGTHADAEVRAILGDFTLSDAAVWPDCVKGVSERWKYESTGKFPECRAFETFFGKRRMVDFVRRNAANCEVKPGGEICHKRYHFTELSIGKSRYELGLPGTRADDVVTSVAAATRVLAGLPNHTEHKIKDKFEALALLTHFVGDLHQPLHVGAIYLDTHGDVLEPDAAHFDPATSTRGGNQLTTPFGGLHSIWDAVPQSMRPSSVDATWVAKANALSTTPGTTEGWPAIWATDSLLQAQQAFEGVTFANLANKQWPTTLPQGYDDRMNTIKDTQLVAAGAHLAELLKSIWP